MTIKALKEFTVPFVGLTLGEHRLGFQINNTFFAHFEYAEFNSASINLQVIMVKKATLLEFTLVFKGHVNIPCDVTNEPYNQPVEGSYHFVVKFGEAYDDTHEDLLVIPHGSHEVNIQQFVYETIILALPVKRIHPGIEDGTLKSEVLEKLTKLSPRGNMRNKKTNRATDPRWDTLKKLLTDK
ncbi:MAG: YceD family protein [Marinirhabdus sp.]